MTDWTAPPRQALAELIRGEFGREIARPWSPARELRQREILSAWRAMERQEPALTAAALLAASGFGGQL